MPRLNLLAALALLATLAACVSPSGGGQPTTSQEAGPPAPFIDAQASPLGLYLAGQAALGEGKGDVAASYFAQAAHDDSDAAFLKDSAFQAALISGDVRRAAQLAPATGEGSAGAIELGQLTRAVEDLAEDRGRDAQALLTGHPLTPPLDTAGKLLLPWAAAAAGDWKTALAAPDTGGDHLVGQIALLDQALLHENRHETGAADQAFRKLLSISDGAGLYTAAYGEFLQRHGRARDAISLYQSGLKTEPSNALLQDALASAQAGHPPPRAPTLQQGAANALLPPAALMLAEKQPELVPLPSYSTLRRFLEAHGLDKRRRLTSRRTEGAERAEARLFDREVRSYEAEYVNGLWHWDCHVGSRKVLTPRGEWQTPILFGVLDDRSRLACHLQWYLAENAENVAHGLSQAFQKRGLPR